MGTFNHKIKPNITQRIPRNWVYFDTEARIKVKPDGIQHHSLRLGVGLYRRNGYGRNKPIKIWFDFKRPYVFWNRCIEYSENDRNLIIIGYNVGYDLRLVNAFNNLARLDYKLTRVYIAQGVIILKWKKEKHNILMLDAMNYFDGSLEKWGSMLGVEKVDVDFMNCTDEKLMKHCYKDVEILDRLMSFWLRFIKEKNLGCFSPTRSSQAFMAFRHRFMEHDIFIHIDNNATKIERESYHGGRVECYQIGKVKAPKIWKLDVNSLYPYIMSVEPVPVKLINYVYKSDLARLQRASKKYAVIARVFVDTPEATFPVIHDKKLIYPIGRFQTVLAGPELKYALKKKYIIDVEDFVQYEQAIIFKPYVKYMYKLRMKYKRQGEDIYQAMVKKMMNSLYGKFGQKSESWTNVKCHPQAKDGTHRILDGMTGQWYRTVVMGGQQWKIVEGEESYNSFPAIASFITSGSRLHLWKLILKAGRENVFYLDTDSLFVNAKGYWNLKKYIDPKKLGFLKLEEVLTSLEIFSAKDYRTNTQTKTKGISKSAVKVGENDYKQYQWEGLRGSISAGDTSKVILTPIVKHLQRTYNRGIVHPDGSVSPWVLDCP